MPHELHPISGGTDCLQAEVQASMGAQQHAPHPPGTHSISR